MVERLALRHGGGRTTIVVGSGALAAARRDLEAWRPAGRLFVVTTDRVRSLHGEALAEALGEPAAVWLEVPEGEAAKRLACCEELWRSMVESGGTRDSGVVGFGGGSVGDLAGFAAGCFLRGVPTALVPSTLLAQVDAAIGGKTAVDLPGAKNSVGLFHHPDVVVADTTLLATLPPAELRAGLVEIVKMAALLAPDLLDLVEARLEALVGGEAEALAAAVAAGARAKIAVVESDPREGGRRQLLNFGHTLGHALEAATDYRGLRHGEAVAYGILFALRLAARRGLGGALRGRLPALLARLELPPLPPVDPRTVLAAMGRDKKVRAQGPVWVLPEALGRARVETGVDAAEVERELERFLEAPWRAASA